MKELFVPKYLADRVIKFGFNKPTLAWYYIDGELKFENQYGYRNYSPAPLWQQVLDWLREEKGICIKTDRVRICDRFEYTLDYKVWHKSYYAAIQSGIEKALDILESQE